MKFFSPLVKPDRELLAVRALCPCNQTANLPQRFGKMRPQVRNVINRGYAASDRRESALVAELPGGNNTAIVRGGNNTMG